MAPPPGRLRLTARRRDVQFREIARSGIPADAASDPGQAAGPALFEFTDYKVHLHSPSGASVRLQHDDPRIVSDLESVVTPASRFGVVNFHGEIGLSRFRVLCDDGPEFDFELEVFPSKVDYLTDYHDLMADAQDIVSGLALEYLRSTFRRGSTRSSPEQPWHVEWLTILRNVFASLERALRQIAKQPLWTLDSEVVPTRIERLRRGGPAARRGLIRYSDAPPKERLEQAQAMRTLNHPEHRWLKAQLIAIRGRLSRILAGEEQQRESARREAILAELRRFEQRVGRLLQLEPIASAEGVAPAGFASLQLLKLSGYREAYMACTELTKALSVQSDAVRLSVKDIEVLYEYWCVLATIRAVARCLGREIPLDEVLSVDEQGVHLRLRRGERQAVTFRESDERTITVTYAPRFSGPAYLISQEPDLEIAIHERGWPVVKIILDAKYRLDTSPDSVTRFGSPGPPSDALNALHRYRDAIVDDERGDKRTVVEAAALFPYRERTPGEFAGTKLWNLLPRIGVGAIPLLPGGERYLEQWLLGLLQRGGFAAADAALPHQLRERSWDWQVAASEVVLVAVTRKDEEEHLSWIRKQRLYYTPETKQTRLFAAKYVAFYTRGKKQRRGAVRHWAPVEAIEVVPRREIATPWVMRQDADERQVLYHLGPVRDGLTIENTGDRFSKNRWSSRLALDRAQIINELALETEPEWRLYERLRAARIDFSLEPLQPRKGASDDLVGRMLFVVGKIHIRHRGGDRFELLRPEQEGVLVRLENVVAALGVGP